MSSPEDSMLRSAMAAHHCGRLTEAEVGYHRVLRKRPNDPHALYGLGLLSFHAGALAKGIELVQRSLVHAPLHGRAWITLGSMHIAAGHKAEAKSAYQRATQVAPQLSDGWYNAGICLKNEGDFDGAAVQLRSALTCEAPYSAAYDALGSLLYQQGQDAEAASTYARWAQREPDNPRARHMAAAASGRQVPDRAANDYVRALFDASAQGFDRNLGELGYRGPELVVAALSQHSGARNASTSDAAPPAAPAPPHATPGIVPHTTPGIVPHATPGTVLNAVLDAGCGTGLCGPLVRPLCRQLSGVDLSPKMLERARARGCYDELVCAELGAFMRSRSGSFDAIVCADTLLYFGALQEPLCAARETLRDAGLFVFTLEDLESVGARKEEAHQDYRLELSGRYAHRESYVREALKTAGFEIGSISREHLREERSRAVAGFLVVARAR